MKVAVIGSHLCPDTPEALHQLGGVGADITLKGILFCHASLRAYLDPCDNSEVHTEIRGTERLGVPCFVCEDGAATLDIQAVPRKQNESFNVIAVQLLTAPEGYGSGQGRFSVREYGGKRFR